MLCFISRCCPRVSEDLKREVRFSTLFENFFCFRGVREEKLGIFVNGDQTDKYLEKNDIVVRHMIQEENMEQQF